MATPEGALPLKKNQIESLREALAQVPDSRRNKRTLMMRTLLTLIGMGLLYGRQEGRFFTVTTATTTAACRSTALRVM